MTKVFVYGTLKRGRGNNRLLDTSEFVKEDTVSNYRLMDSGFPVATPDEGSSVVGEIWSVDKDTLVSLDRLEGYRPGSRNSMYNRETIRTDSEEEVFMYVGNPEVWDFDRMKEIRSDNRVFNYAQRW